MKGRPDGYHRIGLSLWAREYFLGWKEVLRLQRISSRFIYRTLGCISVAIMCLPPPAHSVWLRRALRLD